ncbi:MAG: stage II sporulation protein R [Lachnospiraceae bacterium]|nr:stage II sporulation protein R [Lachnospiraceae bacterium]
MLINRTIESKTNITANTALNETSNRRCLRHYLSSYISSALVILILSLFLNAVAAAAHRSVLQQGIAKEVLRFHVLANSDSEEDQSIKYQVRDVVLAWMSEAAAELTDREAALQFLSENLSQIEAVADGVLDEQGVSYRASAEISKSYFPDRTYGDCSFPAGWYEALRIELGEARGQNWWCLLYPGLCFSDCLHAVVEEDELRRLEDVLTVEEYESILRSPGQWKICFRWF